MPLDNPPPLTPQSVTDKTTITNPWTHLAVTNGGSVHHSNGNQHHSSSKYRGNSPTKDYEVVENGHKGSAARQGLYNIPSGRLSSMHKASSRS
jgi:hypothetical protein